MKELILSFSLFTFSIITTLIIALILSLKYKISIDNFIHYTQILVIWVGVVLLYTIMKELISYGKFLTFFVGIWFLGSLLGIISELMNYKIKKLEKKE